MPIGLLPFILTFIALMVILLVSISWRVWKVANENPADVVKSE